MPTQVCMGASMLCSCGTAPSSLVVLSANHVMVNNTPAANIMDNIPLVNILPFAMCTSLANPAVASATAAAHGVLTPMPCNPVTPAPWVPGAAITRVANIPALHQGCALNCSFGGVITITNPGQATVLTR